MGCGASHPAGNPHNAPSPDGKRSSSAGSRGPVSLQVVIEAAQQAEKAKLVSGSTQRWRLLSAAVTVCVALTPQTYSTNSVL